MLPIKINKAKANTMIAEAATRLGVGVEDLDEENTTFGAECLRRYGSGLPAKTARVLANYIVNMATTEGIDEEKVENLAKSMKGWREFDFGDPRLAKLGAKFVQRQNNYLTNVAFLNPSLYLQEDPNIFSSLPGDANRGIWKFGDTTYPVGTSPDTILNKFRSLVKTPNAQKVISTLLNQSSLADMETLLMKSEATVGSGNVKKLQVETLYNIKGGEMFVSRKPEDDGRKFAADLGITSDHDVYFGLDISKDGKTAVVTVSVVKNLNSKGWKSPEHNIGMATITQRTTVDLTKEMPDVIGITFSQTFTADRINLPPRNEAPN